MPVAECQEKRAREEECIQYKLAAVASWNIFDVFSMYRSLEIGYHGPVSLLTKCFLRDSGFTPVKLKVLKDLAKKDKGHVFDYGCEEELRESRSHVDESADDLLINPAVGSACGAIPVGCSTLLKYSWIKGAKQQWRTAPNWRLCSWYSCTNALLVPTRNCHQTRTSNKLIS